MEARREKGSDMNEKKRETKLDTQLRRGYDLDREQLAIDADTEEKLKQREVNVGCTTQIDAWFHDD